MLALAVDYRRKGLFFRGVLALLALFLDCYYFRAGSDCHMEEVLELTKMSLNLERCVRTRQSAGSFPTIAAIDSSSSRSG
jgi:hypothetical protein